MQNKAIANLATHLKTAAQILDEMVQKALQKIEADEEEADEEEADEEEADEEDADEEEADEEENATGRMLLENATGRMLLEDATG